MSAVSNFRKEVVGTAAGKDGCVERFKAAQDGSLIAANGKFVAFSSEPAGTFIVLTKDMFGNNLGPGHPKVSAHRQSVLDLLWNPYNDNMLASCGGDCFIKIWEFPDSGPLDADRCMLELQYHQDKVSQIAWHPSVSNVLMSVGDETTVAIWNLDQNDVVVEIHHVDTVRNASWAAKGDKIVTACIDRKFRIFDARTGDKLLEFEGHEGSKIQRVIFCNNDECLFSTGFSVTNERQFALWHIELQDNPANSELKKLQMKDVDTGNQCLIAHYDADTQMVYLAGMNDAAIRYYELDPNYLNASEPVCELGIFTSSNSQRALAAIPKRSVDVKKCEVMRFYKLAYSRNGLIEPISMTVPTEIEVNKKDIYPDAIGEEAAMGAFDFFDGTGPVEPKRISME